ncbi:MAG: hypothetical protein Q9M14_03470 [Mariprofundaceae bacterium]|nr:hypothetical protein [Mariprofundaceae bacterium]
MEYFIRHTGVLEISNDDITSMFKQGLVGIHYGSDYKVDPSELLKPDAYKESSAVRSMNYLLNLAKSGGYIWSDYSSISRTLIGKVYPNSKVFLKEFTPTKNLEYFTKNEKNKLFMKCIQLDETQEIKIDQQLPLRARRPRQGTFVKWHKSYGKISKIFGGNEAINCWNDLTPDQQEILVYEYLRETENDEYHIKYLLMPIGRTMKDIDIYGINSSGNKIFIQVTNLKEDHEKIEALRQYPSLLVYAGDVKNRIENNIKFINVYDIFDYFKSDSMLIRMMNV